MVSSRSYEARTVPADQGIRQFFQGVELLQGMRCIRGSAFGDNSMLRAVTLTGPTASAIFAQRYPQVFTRGDRRNR